MLNYFQSFIGPVYPAQYTYPGFFILPQSSSPLSQSQTPQPQQTPQKKYNVISDEKRELLIKLLQEEHYTLKQASEQLEIKLSTAKAIFKIFKTQGRMAKVKQRKKKTIKKVKQPDPFELLKKQLPKLSQQAQLYLNPSVQFYNQNFQ